jgi:hypothetical protein
MTTNINRLVGLARASTTNRSEIANQVAAINRIAEMLGVEEDRLTIVEAVGVSASDLPSSEVWLEQVMPLLENPDTHLVVESLDRLDRGVGILAELEASGTRTYTPNGEFLSQGREPKPSKATLVVPTPESGDASEYFGYPPGTISWADIDEQLREGTEHLPGGSSLHQLCVEMGLTTDKKVSG